MSDWQAPERYYEVHVAGQVYFVDCQSGERLATVLDGMTVQDVGYRSDHKAFVEVACVDGAEMRLLLCEIEVLVETGPDDRERWEHFRSVLKANRRWEEE